MRIFITGGLGFVGTALTGHLLDRGHLVTVAARRAGPGLHFGGRAQVLMADTSLPGSWQGSLASQDLVINLAGATVFRRWTGRAREEIRRSRIDTTRNVVDAIEKSGRGIPLFSTSAVGYYGYCGDEAVDEESAGGDDFLAGICAAWEEEAARAERCGSRVVLCRFGIVLGRDGGALAQMASLFSKRLGSVLGSGRQYFSWIHMDDLLGIYDHLLARKDVAGPVNFTAPSPVTNRELTGALSRVLGKRVLLPPAPSIALRIALGEFGGSLLNGQRALPRKMLKSGYAFRFPEILPALAHLLRQGGI
ncbi:MAG: TIGR01777 family oxidoreductase [Spirochaetes bacterium]|nr:TIGR01777 family oxidoreductase [Spirochaetota bacterium]